MTDIAKYSLKPISALGLVLLLSGCSMFGFGGNDASSHKHASAAHEGKQVVESRQVGLSRYESQGTLVEETTNWYYGETEGLSAYAVEGGIIYVQEEEDGGEEESQSSEKDDPNASSKGPIKVNPEDIPCLQEQMEQQESEDSDGESYSEKDAGERDAGDRSTDGDSESEPKSSTQKLDSASGTCGVSSSYEEPVDVSLGTLEGRFSFYFDNYEDLYEGSDNRLTQLLDGDPPSGRIHVLGFTDDIGTDDYNIPLSEERARSIAERIESAWPDVDVSYEGRGGCPQLKPNTSPEARATNRRAEVYSFEDMEVEER